MLPVREVYTAESSPVFLTYLFTLLKVPCFGMKNTLFGINEGLSFSVAAGTSLRLFHNNVIWCWTTDKQMSAN